MNRDLLKEMYQTSLGQYPFAVVLSCIDSRVPAELVFDQGIGDIFSIRIAGNIINNDILGSIEFSCKLEGSKVLLILGHTKCGAIKGACNDAKLGHLTGLLDKIKPAIASEDTVHSERTASNDKFVECVSRLNVVSSINQVLNQSEIMNEMVKEGKVMIVGGMYCIDSGKVDFFWPES
jgi:carbonic anhydrase